MRITGFLRMDKKSLAVFISDFVQSTPPEITHEVAIALENFADHPLDYIKAKLLQSIHSPQTKSQLSDLINCWMTNYPVITSHSLALALETSLITFQASQKSPLELIWSGPVELSNNFRRTDQALLELISEAEENLLIVSFAVYKAQAIIKAIEKALLRGVNVVICLEDANESQGKVSVSGSKAFSSSSFRLASFYTWPIENRPHTHDGKFGSLHAKLAVADEKRVFISSANLTDHAMELNMEMGVLIEDDSVGGQVVDLFNDMIVNSVLKKLPIIS
jgi:phosphatidylserine/phosphatidylglycerophosphate/cardiolipin synthase-like enzyme